MKRRTRILTAMCLLALAGAWLFWALDRQNAITSAPQRLGVSSTTTASTAKRPGVAGAKGGPATPSFNTNKLAFRLSNTTNSIRQLQTKPHAILLANALIDTEKGLDLKIPAHLKSSGDPGAYIVQARGVIGAPFRALLASANAQVVSYIPNNAYLVNIPANVAGQLTHNPLVQAVLPYEPYYKLQTSLLGLAVNEQPLPPGTALTLGLFAADATTAEAKIEALGAKIIGHDQSPFGPVLRVLAPTDWTALVQSPVVQFAEPAFARRNANDLSRVTLGISPDTISPVADEYTVNGFVLTGSNVLVAVNDSGVDTNHPGFSVGGSAAANGTVPPSRVTGLTYLDMVDTNGHGTHVAGIIAGNGSESITPVNVGTFAEGSIPNADYRGKAPLANLFSLNYGNYTDYQLQTNAALAGALISNNSWDYGNGDAEYDLAAASYDFATRDALPATPGSQPVLFVFAAGNDGGGGDDGTGGAGDTILSPGTAKNVITVGALQQLRYITNIVTTFNSDGTSNQSQPWLAGTESGDLVAGYSSRGNVGIQVEGSNGRFKPDVVAPGTFVVSTSSQFNDEWDTNAYYNHSSNVLASVYTGQVVPTNGFNYYTVQVPPNAIGITVTVSANTQSPNPFPDLPIYCQQSGYPDPVNAPGSIDITSYNNMVAIPPGGGNCTLGNLLGNGFDIAVGNATNFPVDYNLTVGIEVTNDVGNYYTVLEGMNDSLGGYYRYETGTSMAAAAVSGVLALIQDYFTNQLQTAPSPALMKAVLINGCRSVADYEPALTNGINFEGWGLENIQDCVPYGGLFSQPDGTTTGSSFFVDQSPATALATGDSHTYIVNLNTSDYAQYLQLQATLVWTDPPGDPAAAIKLVNNLVLIITNLDTGDVYYGNDISPAIGYNLPSSTNAPPNIDSINNVQNILLPPLLATNYSVTVVGRSVNVNAVTAQINNAAGQYAPNIVQDYALVVSVGEGELTNAFTVTSNSIVSNPTGDQDYTVVITTNAPLVDQMVGASSPLLGTNTLPLGNNTIWGPNGVVTFGQTNQWHFYVVTNTGLAPDYTNAAFLIFDVSTLSLPRMGVYENDPTNATTPEANLDLFVTQDPSITNLNPVAISNCLAGVGNCRASLANAGTQFVYYTDSIPGQSVYYIGVQSEDQMAAEYDFLPVFTDIPFSQLDQNGNQIVNGLLLPMPTPVGNNTHPGVTNIFALAIMPMVVEKVIVTNLIQHQNFGDLYGTLSFGGQYAVLNNHDGFGNTTLNTTPRVYDDTTMADRPLGTTNSDGPGSLLDFRGKSAIGPWILTELDDSAGGFTGQVARLTLLIQPHRNLKQPGVFVYLPPGGWFIDWVDVPAGYTNLTFYGTNVTIPSASPPLEMFERFGDDPTLTDYDQEATLDNGAPPGNSISIGPPLAQGQYFVGLYNPSQVQQEVFITATLGQNASVNNIFNYTATSGQELLDDAVTPGPGPDPSIPVTGTSTTGSGSYITVPATVTNEVASVNVGIVVESPRISDYAFTLVSPTGQRILLMENRGGGDTNGAGMEFVYTNVLNVTATGGSTANTNYLPVTPGEVVPIIWNFYTAPDQMTVYSVTNPAAFIATNGTAPGPYLLYNTGMTNNPHDPSLPPGAQNTLPYTEDLVIPFTTPPITNITIIMNQFGSPDTGGDAWIYTAGAPNTNYEYLEFTDSTNLASVPIKFAEPPFSFAELSSNYTLSDFNLSTNGDYRGLTNIYDAYGGWTVPTNLVTVSTVATNGGYALVTNTVALTNNFVSVVSDASIALGGDAGSSNYLALAYGTITRSIPTVPGRIYNVTFWYRGPAIEGWWRGEGNGNDSSDPENNNNNGALIGRFNFPAGEVDQAFEFEDPGNTYQFAGTNTYVQVPASASLNVSGFTVEGWIAPTNLLRPEPLVEWLARVPTNPATADPNLAIVQGPVLNPANGNYYYLLSPTNRQTSELWAEEMNGHLVTLTTANLENWVYDTFTAYGTQNRDLWTGLGYTNNAAFGWTSGYTNLPFTDWAPGQPAQCGHNDQYYVAILGPTNAYPGLWALEDNLGLTCDAPPTNPIYGVVEVTSLPTNGVQFWISGTNWTPGYTNYMQGCLYANIVDTNYVSHPIWSAPGLLTTNVYQHVALTFNANSGVAALYLNGTNVATSNLYSASLPIVTNFVPKTDGDLLLGWDMSRYTNNYYSGEMDEMSLYGRVLSDAEIYGIFNVSASTTNRAVGKFDATVTPAVGLAEAVVTFGTTSNLIYGVNNQWEENSYTFTATATNLPLTITGTEPGILLDDFSVAEAPATNLYYFPEQALAALNGTAAGGTWTLQVWDSRVGAFVTNVDQLVNWQLSFVLVSNAVIAASLPPETPVTTTVPSGQTVYYSVTVPAWAQYATNLLVSSSLPVNLLYFEPTNYPGYGLPPYTTLLTGQTTGIGQPILGPNPVPPQLQLVAGTTYYLGVQNNNAQSATVVLQVDYDLVTLTNSVPFTDKLKKYANVDYSSARYFAFDVSSNAYEATFQLLQLSGNADLVLSQGAPLPSLTSDTYGSFNNGTADQNIYVLTNSAPVPLSAGTWYLGVVNRGAGDVAYSVLAKELDLTNLVLPTSVMPAIINLTNDVPFAWTAGPGAALTNFFHFQATNPVVGGTNVPLHGLRFELYNLSGNGDLTLQSNALPLAPPFYQSSQNDGTGPELILLFTNSVLTNLAADWYLGVPNREVTNITYSIVVETLTNSYFPAFPGAQSAEGAGGGAVGAGHAGTTSTVYHVTTTADSGPSSLRAAVAATNCTVVFDVGGTISLASPLIITNSNLTIAGQTSPGGVTVAGQMTMLTGAHDVIIRDIRFRPGGSANGDALQFSSLSNVIADHITASWSSNNLVSVYNSTNVTVQWSMMANGLYSGNASLTNPPTGSLLRQGGGALSFHHNLYADNYSGSPQLGDNLTLDFINNVIFNWGAYSGLSDGTSDGNGFSPGGCTNQLNYVCNYLIAGLDTANFAPNNYNMTNIAFFGGQTNAQFATWIFQTNNFMDSDNNGVLNGADTGWGMFTNDYTPFAWPFATPPVSVDEAYQAYEQVLDFAGADLALRDPVDTNIVYGVRYQTGRLISQSPFVGLVAWWRAEGNALDSAGANNGTLEGGLGFAPGEVGQAFNFTNTSHYVLVPASSSLNVGADGGFTIDEWINTTNLSTQMPLFVWGTNSSGLIAASNLVAGPILNSTNGHYYYLLASNSWTGAEALAEQMGGHLATIRSLGEELWVSNAFANYGGKSRNLWIGLYDPSHDPAGGHGGNFVWVDGETNAYRDWAFQQPDNVNNLEFWTIIQAPSTGPQEGGQWNDVFNSPPVYITNGLANVPIYGVVELTNPPAGPGPSFWVSVGSAGCLYANLLDTTNGSHPFASKKNIIKTGYRNVALTYSTNTGIATLYHDGVVVATTNLGVIIPNTTGNVYLGKSLDGVPTDTYSGGMDEVMVYDYALPQVQIQDIYNFGHAGINIASNPSGFPYLDTDQDGLPDFWEDTFTPGLVYIPSNNHARTGDGYTDLEEYNNWLAGPHAVTTVTNPVSVDLYRLCGDSGNLAFYVTNSVQGFVYLTNVLGSVTNTSALWSNTIAVFTPTNSASTNYYGYAAFDFYVTNLDTAAYFGPVTVSVIVSPVPILLNSNIPPVLNPLVSGLSSDPTNYGGSDFYYIDITTNDVGVLFEVDNPTGPMAMVLSDSTPYPSLYPGNYEYYTNQPPATANLQIAVLTNSMPVPLHAGRWYMAAINESGSNVVYTAKATVYTSILPPVFLYPTNTTVTNILATVPWGATCVALDLDTPPLPLAFGLVSGPTNMTVSTTGLINWTPAEVEGYSTNLVAVSVSNGAFSVTNTFTIIVEDTNIPPVLPFIPRQFVFLPNSLVVTNTATELDPYADPLTYLLTTSPAPGTNSPVIDTNGIITWAPTDDQAFMRYRLTTVVTNFDPGAVNATSLSDTNRFDVIVLPSNVGFLPPGQPDTNVVAPGGINWFVVQVPTNAIYATNTLLFATAPVNLWYSTDLPPTTTNSATDGELLGNVLHGISVLNTNLATAPTNLVPGGFYFLGVQNPNLVPVTNALRVDFGYAFAQPLPPGVPATNVVGANGLNWFMVNVPTNAVAATNLLLFATAPVNLWYSINVPPTITNSTDAELLTNATSGFAVLYTNAAPVLVPGGTYYLGVQNPNDFSVTNAVVVEFEYAAPPPPALTPGVPNTNVVSAGSLNWFTVNVPANAVQATNALLFATAPVNFWFSTNLPPTITNPGDSELLSNALAGSVVLSTNLTVAPTNTVVIVPGGTYYLGVQNTNSFAVTNAVEVTFHLVYPPFSIFSIVATNNAAGSNGYLITWFAPTNDQFHLQWSPALAPQYWTNFLGVISDASTATNGVFQYFDDGSQSGGFGPTRFYRLLLLNSPTNTAPFFLYAPTIFFVNPTNQFVFSNPAKDWDVPAQILTYGETNSLGAAGCTINPATGVITWTPGQALLGQTNFITTTVSDNGVPPKSAVNTFEVVVGTNTVAAPAFSSISIGTNGVTFLWTAPTNDQFQIRWTTNLALALTNWNTFPVTNTSTSGNFIFVDTNTLKWMEFYQLILLP